MTKSIRKLINTFRPESYDIHLNVYLNSMTFKGIIKVNGLKIGPPSHRLTFHQQNLKISNAAIIRHNKSLEQSMTVNRINHHKSFNEVRLHTSEQLYGGNYTITMNFNGLIGSDIKDMFLNSLKLNKKIQLDTSQFESYFIRKLFPCIDDPEVKVNFNLKIVTPK